MTERCKRNPCCGDYLDCKPPPQFKPRESYEACQERTAPAPAPVDAHGFEDDGWDMDDEGRFYRTRPGSGGIIG